MILTGLLLYFFFIDRSIVNFRWFFIFLSENNEGVLTEMNMIMSNWKCELYNYVKIWVITLANWIMYYQKIKFCMKLNLIYNSTKSKLTLTALGCWLAHQTAPLHDFSFSVLQIFWHQVCENQTSQCRVTWAFTSKGRPEKWFFFFSFHVQNQL